MPLTSNRKEIRHFNVSRKTDYLLFQVDDVSERKRKKIAALLESPNYQEVARDNGIVLLKPVTDAKTGN